MRNVGLQHLRGLKASIPTLLIGEVYFCTDTQELIVGTGTGIVGLPLTPISAAQFINKDTTTQGTWHGVYGADGYVLAGIATSLPAYATATVVPSAIFNWASPTTDVRALQIPLPGTSRSAETWYNSTTFAVNLNVGTSIHRVAMYMVDWDVAGRAMTITVNDANTGFLLDTQTVSAFSNGVWLVWNIVGNINITFTQTAGINAVLSGILFG